ncbi:MAG: phosphoenolpyruvate--protein phosphotransferase, partial [Lachnospiraceae bacterium]|nr:phosphoenolpyruvate--protein phosphotransferase [Lachnospiraceae bacterium]
MRKFDGKSVYKGIAVGPVAVLSQKEEQVRRSRIAHPEAELARVREAVGTAQEQLQALYEKAVAQVGEASAAIFEVHQMMLEDDDYLDAIYGMIRTELVNAEYAVAVTGDNFSEMFSGMEDDYMKARAADVKDISNRLIQCLGGQEGKALTLREPSIIVADDLSPSETVQMDKTKILAIVTVHGSANSHTSILARMMNIPALIGVALALDEITSGTDAVVDGTLGEFILAPDDAVRAQAQQRLDEELEKRRLLQ